MREDMSKVVIERPRRGHWMRSRKTALRVRQYDPDTDYDTLPDRVSGSRNKHLRINADVKYFSDLLRPLCKYLRSNLGRPWDKVWSEISQHLDTRKTTGQHILDHVHDLVSEHCFIGDDGQVYEYRAYRKVLSPVDGLYVDPRTGLLCESKEKYPRTLPAPKPEPVTHIRIGKHAGYFRLDGEWFLLEYRGRMMADRDWDKRPDADFIRLANGKKQLVTFRHQLNQEERKAAGLTNNTEPESNPAEAKKRRRRRKQAGKSKAYRATNIRALLSADAGNVPEPAHG